jgi:hypothetical protein
MPPPEQYLEVWLCVRLQGKRFLAPPVVTEELGVFLCHTIDEELHMHHFLLRIKHLNSERHGDLVFADAGMAYRGRLMVHDMELGRFARLLVAVTIVSSRIRHIVLSQCIEMLR